MKTKPELMVLLVGSAVGAGLGWWSGAECLFCC